MGWEGSRRRVPSTGPVSLYFVLPLLPSSVSVAESLGALAGEPEADSAQRAVIQDALLRQLREHKVRFLLTTLTWRCHPHTHTHLALVARSLLIYSFILRFFAPLLSDRFRCILSSLVPFPTPFPHFSSSYTTRLRPIVRSCTPGEGWCCQHCCMHSVAGCASTGCCRTRRRTHACR